MLLNEPTPNRIARIVAVLILAAVVGYGFSTFSSGHGRARLVQDAQIAHPTITSARIEGNDLVLVSFACSDAWLEERRASLRTEAESADIETIRCVRR